jgi:hypothetical protein
MGFTFGPADKDLVQWTLDHEEFPLLISPPSGYKPATTDAVKA